jgi:hypothetical protein
MAWPDDNSGFRTWPEMLYSSQKPFWYPIKGNIVEYNGLSTKELYYAADTIWNSMVINPGFISSMGASVNITLRMHVFIGNGWNSNAESYKTGGRKGRWDELLAYHLWIHRTTITIDNSGFDLGSGYLPYVYLVTSPGLGDIYNIPISEATKDIDDPTKYPTLYGKEKRAFDGPNDSGVWYNAADSIYDDNANEIIDWTTSSGIRLDNDGDGFRSREYPLSIGHPSILNSFTRKTELPSEITDQGGIFFIIDPISTPEREGWWQVNGMWFRVTETAATSRTFSLFNHSIDNRNYTLYTQKDKKLWLHESLAHKQQEKDPKDYKIFDGVPMLEPMEFTSGVIGHNTASDFAIIAETKDSRLVSVTMEDIASSPRTFGAMIEVEAGAKNPVLLTCKEGLLALYWKTIPTKPDGTDDSKWWTGIYGLKADVKGAIFCKLTQDGGKTFSRRKIILPPIMNPENNATSERGPTVPSQTIGATWSKSGELILTYLLTGDTPVTQVVEINWDEFTFGDEPI